MMNHVFPKIYDRNDETKKRVLVRQDDVYFSQCICTTVTCLRNLVPRAFVSWKLVKQSAQSAGLVVSWCNVSRLIGKYQKMVNKVYVEDLFLRRLIIIMTKYKVA